MVSALLLIQLTVFFFQYISSEAAPLDDLFLHSRPKIEHYEFEVSQEAELYIAAYQHQSGSYQVEHSDSNERPPRPTLTIKESEQPENTKEVPVVSSLPHKSKEEEMNQGAQERGTIAQHIYDQCIQRYDPSYCDLLKPTSGRAHGKTFSFQSVSDYYNKCLENNTPHFCNSMVIPVFGVPQGKTHETVQDDSNEYEAYRSKI